MITFYLPDFCKNFHLNFQFIQFFKDNKEMFYDDIKIGSIFGVFPPSIWGGGRYTPGYSTVEQMKDIINAFNNLGVGIRYTFTNSLIEERHLYDTFCNLELEIAASTSNINEVLVYSDLLEEYVRDKYPSIPIISSTTKNIRTEDGEIEEAEKDYKLVVLEHDFNPIACESEKLISRADKFEILLDSFCPDNCPVKSSHLAANSNRNINFTSNEHCCGFDGVICIKENGENGMTPTFYQTMDKRKNFVTVEDLYGKFKTAGYKHFKVDGRQLSQYDVLESYVYYMVKPEYKDRVRLYMLRLVAPGW
jgi:collagenase-like PrtC family protease